MQEKRVWLKMKLGLIVLICMGFSQVFLSQAGAAGGNASQRSFKHYDFTDQLIVKFREPSIARAEALSSMHINALSAVAGVALTHFRAMSGDSQVLKLPHKMTLAQVKAIANKLNADPLVEYAEPDLLMFPQTVPNDPQYANQWHYKSPSAPDYEVAGVNLPETWDITTGSSGIVVAVIDSGLVPHADIDSNILDDTGRVLPGYDFITDSLNANDGNGRDSDPSDPGNWITTAESASGYFVDCLVRNSNWHGTHVSGTVGALTNNGAGVAGVNWTSEILPVRVLGKCGGYSSDIIDGMRWAAGQSFSGVPTNTNPAKVLNFSLGGAGVCSTEMQTAITEIVTAGTVVIVAAGNYNDNVSNYNPANCNGVISVGSVNSVGARADYSNYGTIVKIAAPGGEMSYSGDPGGILSTLNSGTNSPIASPAGDTYEYYQGTSMAAPHVAGIATLMLAVNPTLTPAQVLQIIQDTARPFPIGTGNDCTTSICGAGIIDAYSAVQTANSLMKAPVLDPEPAITTGTENTIYWSDVSATSGSMAAGDTGGSIAGIFSRPIDEELNVPQLALHTVSETPMRSKNQQVKEYITPAQATLDLERVIVPQDEGEKALPTSVAPLTATTLFNETFEGAFPGSSWTLLGNPTWGDTSYDNHGGSWSGWCGGSALNPANGYVDNMNASMIYGPFSLADATSASMSFWYKNHSESDYDYFGWGASLDGVVDYYGYMVSGDQNSWRSQVFDLTNVPTLGDLTGQSQVWIKFIFTSDDLYSGPTYTGAYVDDIVISKEFSGTPDLTVYKLPNWIDSIPVGIAQLSWDEEHSYAGPYYDDQLLYFNLAPMNQGSSTASGYTVHVEVTGTGGDSWDWSGPDLDQNNFAYLPNDQAVGPLAAGSHTFKVWVDYYDTVSESNEGNNYYERTITVSPSLVEYFAESADNPNFNSPISSGWIMQTQWTFSNLTPGQTYWYRVKAKRGTDESNWSNIELSLQEPLHFSVVANGAGNGSGMITGDLAGDVIDALWNGDALSGDNSALVNKGSGPYTLNAAAASGSTVSWTAGCDSTSGNGTVTAICTLNAPVTSNKNVTATFECSLVYYLDDDSDGFGDPNEYIIACEPPAGYVTNQDDCDDSDPNIPLAGDINADGNVDISDAIIALQILTGYSSAENICTSADINEDSRIGIEEVIYILQVISHLKP